MEPKELIELRKKLEEGLSRLKKWFNRHKNKIAIAGILLILVKCMPWGEMSVAKQPSSKQHFIHKGNSKKRPVFTQAREVFPIKCDVADSIVKKEWIHVRVEPFTDLTGRSDSFPKWQEYMDYAVRHYSWKVYSPENDIYYYFRINDSLHEPDLIFHSEITEFSMKKGNRRVRRKSFLGVDTEGKEYRTNVHTSIDYIKVFMSLDLTVLTPSGCVVSQRTQGVETIYDNSRFHYDGPLEIVPKYLKLGFYSQPPADVESAALCRGINNTMIQCLQRYHSIALRPIYNRKRRLGLQKKEMDEIEGTAPAYFNF